MLQAGKTTEVFDYIRNSASDTWPSESANQRALLLSAEYLFSGFRHDKVKLQIIVEGYKQSDCSVLAGKISSKFVDAVKSMKKWNDLDQTKEELLGIAEECFPEDKNVFASLAQIFITEPIGATRSFGDILRDIKNHLSDVGFTTPHLEQLQSQNFSGANVEDMFQVKSELKDLVNNRLHFAYSGNDLDIYKAIIEREIDSIEIPLQQAKAFANTAEDESSQETVQATQERWYQKTRQSNKDKF